MDEKQNALHKLLNNRLFIWLCAGLIFLGLLSLKNKTVLSDNIIQEVISIVKSSPAPTKKQLEPVPETAKGVYLTAWSASNNKKIDEVVNLARQTEINAVIIDIKDYTGKIFFRTQSQGIKDLGSEKERIKNFDELIARLHQDQIYVIARMAVFQDLFLAEHWSEYAVKNSTTGKIWRDNKNLAWVDPGSKDVWDYNIEIAKEAARLGVDEINFDYIRFPSDGQLSTMSFPFYDQRQISKPEQIREFFEYLSQNLKNENVKISADLFGQSAFDTSDMNIGQILEYALPYFDFICPMVYPSHYAENFIGYKNPALYPYEVIDYSMEKAVQRREILNQALNTGLSNASSTVLIPSINIEKLPQNTKLARFRPWLQVFDLGATYTPEMIRSQIRAVDDNNIDSGWYLWSPGNIYNPEALKRE